MENAKLLLWGTRFLNFTKEVGSKIADGAVYAAQKTKEGAIFVGQKTKEGAHFVAERTKPAAEKIKGGVQNAYYTAKSKITGEKLPTEEEKIQQEDVGAVTNEQLDQGPQNE